MKDPKPVYYEDILKQLKFSYGTPLVARLIIEYVESVQQTIARAGDEIEKLRKENKELRKKLADIPLVYRRDL